MSNPKEQSFSWEIEQNNDRVEVLTREHIMFLGNTLGPFYLIDPTDVKIAPAFTVISALNAENAADDWPFVKKQTALKCMREMQQDLSSEQGSKDYIAASDEALVWEYRRLFVGPAKKPAPPWGSVYTDWEGVVFGESTLVLRKWMRENGIVRIMGEGTPEDHMGVLLLLMAWIAEAKPELLIDFLRLHVLTWSSHFLVQLENAAEHSFYAGLARLTRESLEAVKETLEIDVAYPRYFR